MRVLAIDQGTSSTKALVVEDGGRIAAAEAVAVNPRSGPGGAVEQDANELLDSIITAGRHAMQTAGGRIDAIGIANQGETVLAWDPRTGEPLGPAVSWQDRRAVAVTEGLADRAERLTEITGLPLDPYFSAPKLNWLAARVQQGAVVGPVDAWINRQLTGRYMTDAATASRTLLLDLHSGEWSQEACDVFGIDIEALPEIVDCAGPLGETGAFGDELPVAGLVVDQQAALFAESCLEAGEAKCTYGTGAFLLANAGQRPASSTSRLASCMAWRLGGISTYCLDGQVYSAGSALTWLEQIGLVDGAAALDQVESSVPDADSPVFVPGLSGLAAPFWAPTARGAWLGLSLASSRDDLISGFIWGIAAQVASLARAMQSDLATPIRALRVDGGMTRSARLMQAQADLLQAPVEVYPSPDATALGAAAFARIGATGAALDARSAVGAWRPASIFEPQISTEQAEQIVRRFERCASLLVELAADER